MLTKTLFVAGLECPKRIWLTTHRPELKASLSEAVLERMRSGQEVGRLARMHCPSGTLIPVNSVSNDEAVRLTREAMSTADAIFEATIACGELLVRVDILRREAGGWRVVEVKANGSYDAGKHLPDITFQVNVLRQAGVRVVGGSLLLLNKDYVWEGGDYDVRQLFVEKDLTSEIEAALPGIQTGTERLLPLLKSVEFSEPDPCPMAACSGCDFENHCMSVVPSSHIFFTGLHWQTTKKFRDGGIVEVSEVVATEVKEGTPRMRLLAHQTGEVQIGTDLRADLDKIQYPAHLIDFETLRTDLPVIPGTSPFELLAFQWSCHTLTGPETEPIHSEFVHEAQSDPRQDFVRSLLKIVQEGGSIVHYSSYEKTVIKDMTKKGIPGADQLEKMMEERGVDLEAIVKTGLAHPGFKGKSSIKSVLPVLAADLSYKELAIPGGDLAQIVYCKSLTAECSEEERQQIYRDLKDYCRLDTLAMVRVLKALREAVVEG